MFRAYEGLVAPRSKPGDRIAFEVSKSDYEKILKTYFIYDGQYEADDETDEKDAVGGDAKDVPTGGNSSNVAETALRLVLSHFNNELLTRVLQVKDLGLLDLAQPASQKTLMKKGIAAILHENHTDDLPVPGAGAGAGGDQTQGLLGQEITLPIDGDTIFLPASADETTRMAIPGPTGVGKTRWVAQYCNVFRREHPWDPSLERKSKKRKAGLEEEEEDEAEEDEDAGTHSNAKPTKKVNFRIVVFSFFDHDPAFDNIEGLFYVKLDAEIIKKGLNQDKYKNSLCIFDDVEALTGSLHDVVITFRDQCLKTGRKKGISTVSIIHEMFGGLETRTTWKESESVVVFPRADTAQIKNLLQRKYGMPKEEIEYVTAQKTRAVLIKRTHPRIMLTRTKIRALN